MPAEWGRHGRAAGPIRNRELLKQAIARAVAHTSPVDQVSVLVVAFPGGAGTASLVQQARRMASRSPVFSSLASPSHRQGHRRQPGRRDWLLQSPADRHRPFALMALVNSKAQAPKWLGDAAGAATFAAVFPHKQQHP